MVWRRSWTIKIGEVDDSAMQLSSPWRWEQQTSVEPMMYIYGKIWNIMSWLSQTITLQTSSYVITQTAHTLSFRVKLPVVYKFIENLYAKIALHYPLKPNRTFLYMFQYYTPWKNKRKKKTDISQFLKGYGNRSISSLSQMGIWCGRCNKRSIDSATKVHIIGRTMEYDSVSFWTTKSESTWLWSVGLTFVNEGPITPNYVVERPPGTCEGK